MKFLSLAALFGAASFFQFPLFAQETPPTPTKMEIKTLRVAQVIYTSGKRGQLQLSADEVAGVRGAGELVRLFYFRNSRARLNLDIEPFLVDKNLPRSNDANAKVEADLRAIGAKDGDFDLVFALGPDAPLPLENAEVLGGAPFAIGGASDSIPLQNWPQHDPNIHYGAALSFATELHGALERLIEREGKFQLLSRFPYFDKGAPGFKGGYRAFEGYDWLALSLREFGGEDWAQIRGVRGQKLTTNDLDGDKMPDQDERLPFDETRFDSSAAFADSDGDGLSDLGEFCASIYGFSNPNADDSDGDGQNDDVDAYPIFPNQSRVPFGRRDTDAKPVFGGAAPVAASWNESGLTLFFPLPTSGEAGVKNATPGATALLLSLDGSAQNGFWKGGDSYALRIENGAVWFDGYGFKGRVPDATAREMTFTIAPTETTPETASAPILKVFLPANLGQGISQEAMAGGERLKEDVASGLTLKSGQKIALGAAWQNADGSFAPLTPPFVLVGVELE